jgi:hypothetical protein
MQNRTQARRKTDDTGSRLAKAACQPPQCPFGDEDLVKFHQPKPFTSRYNLN